MLQIKLNETPEVLQAPIPCAKMIIFNGLNQHEPYLFSSLMK